MKIFKLNLTLSIEIVIVSFLNLISCASIYVQVNALLLEKLASSENRTRTIHDHTTNTQEQDYIPLAERKRKLITEKFERIADNFVEISSFLDHESIISFEKASKLFYVFHKDFIKSQLSNFSPLSLFVFKEHWMNRIMFTFVKIFFFPYNVELISDKRIYDALGMANFNFKNDLQLSSEVKYLLLSYTSGIVFGPNDIVPFHSIYYNYYIAQQFTKYYMPNSNAYYSTSVKDFVREKYENKLVSNEVFQTVTNILEDFLDIVGNNSNSINNNNINSENCHSHQSIKAKFLPFYLKYYNLFASVTIWNDDPLYFLKGIKFAIFNIFHLELESVHLEFESAFRFKHKLIEAFSYSFMKETIDFLPDAYLRSIISNISTNDWRVFKEIYCKIPMPATDPGNYLFTRDQFSAPFDLLTFSNFVGDKFFLIKQFCTFSNTNNYQIEIFRQIIGSGIYDFQKIYPSWSSIQYSAIHDHSQTIIFSIILREAPVPINMFYGNGYLMHIFNSRNRNRNDNDFKYLIELYIKYLKNIDPLPILFISSNYFSFLKNLIIDKFNLKNLYTFPAESLNIYVETVRNDQWAELQGKTVGIQRIIKVLFPENYSLYLNTFTSYPEVSEIFEHDGSLPISVYKFIHYAVVEPNDFVIKD